MPRIFLIRILVFFVALISQQLQADNEVLIAPAAEWIIPYQVSDNPKNFDSPESGVHYLLVDYQTLVGNDSVEHFYHVAMKLSDLTAIEENSSLLFDYDPDYEQLSIHNITTIRKGQLTQQLQADRIRLLDRETELEKKIFNGTKTASIILEDVRIGDIIEYSYSVKGTNPAFQHTFYSQRITQFSEPVQEYKLRLLHPQHRQINIKNHKTDLKPQVFNKNNQVEYRWERNNLAAISSDGQVPADFTLYPWIQFSEDKTWQDVVQWALPLYQPEDQSDPEMQAIIQQIANQNPSSEQRLLAVFQFVQEQIRYLGIEIGSGSYIPNPASLVLKRRFGDCKDKTVLMITLLKALDIEAYPALVNTELQQGISKWQPSAIAFDHVLVYAKLNGKGYWLDPTRSPQKGTLDSIYQPDYGLALLVKADTKKLHSMQSASISRKSIVEEWRFNDADDSASYKTTTHYYGNWADYMRQYLASKSLQETQKSYINYLAKIYPSITLNQPFKISDDPVKNEISVEENYSVSNYWQDSKDEPQKLETGFYPVDFFEYVTKPTTLHRTMPLEITHPVNIEQKTLIHLGDGWPLKDEKLQLKNPGFAFDKVTKYADGILHVDYRYHTKSRSVNPNDMKYYLADLKTMDDELGYGLWKLKSNTGAGNDSEIEQINWTLMILFMLASVIFLAISIWVYRYDPKKPFSLLAGIDPKLAGIGGWLIIPAIGIMVNPFISIHTLYVDMLPALSLPVWNNLTQISSEMYHPAWAPMLIVAALVNLGLIFIGFAMILLFFQKRRTFPRFYILFLAFSMVFIIMDNFAMMSFEPLAEQYTSADTGETIRTAIFSLIWISYFRFSKRVKATFVNSRV